MIIPILIIFFIFLMLYFAYLDHRSLKERQHKDYKSIIVSAGVLGTFLGIFLGLLDFDTDTKKIIDSVPPLLEGLKMAFVTSIAGMFISISLSALQKGDGDAVDDDISALKSINSKLDQLQYLEKVDQSNRGIVEQMKNFRMEVRDEQLKSRTFIEENFKKTNESLEKAIETLSQGATKEIIKALEGVIADFNKNLKEQFGENFKQLNEAVLKLIKWQDNYKVQVENNEKLLVEIQESLSKSKDTFELIASRNSETQDIYKQLKEVILTYDTQVKSLNEQLKAYSELGSDAKTFFAELHNGFKSINEEITQLTNNIKTTVSTQSESLTKITEDISNKLPASLGVLENTLTGLTSQFAKDYRSFLDTYNNLLGREERF
ncbi:MAG: hypothetical protein ACE5HI_05420 [bacterium]